MDNTPANNQKTGRDESANRVCPYFCSGEDGCDVGMSNTTAHEIELMVSYCNNKFNQCSRYRMLKGLAQAKGPSGPKGLGRNGGEVAWDVLEHELRTPLAAILASGEILERYPDKDAATRQKFVKVIIDESRRLKNTVEALFDGLESVSGPETRIETIDAIPKTIADERRRTTKMKSTGWHKGWNVVLAATGINLALGILYAWSIFKDAIKSSIEAGGANGFNWELSSINDPYALCCLVFAFAMIVAGKVQDKFGPRLTALMGGLLVGAGFIVMSLSSSYAAWVIGFGVLAGLGIGFGYSAATPPALKWFPPAKTGMIAGIVVSGFGLASVYIAPLAKYLLAAYGLKQSMLIFGLAFAVIVSALAMMLKNPPLAEKTKLELDDKKQVVSAPADATPAQMLKSVDFYALWAIFCAASGAGLMVIGSIAGMAKASLGEMSFIAVVVLAIGNAGGRIVAGIVSDKIGRVATLASVLLFQAVLMYAAVPVIGSGNTSSVLLVGLTGLIGFNYGTNLSLFPSLVKDRWGLSNFGTNYGLLFSAWGVGGLIAGRISQMLYAETGNYSSSFLTAFSVLIMAAGVTLVLKETRRPILMLMKNVGLLKEEETEKRKAA